MKKLIFALLWENDKLSNAHHQKLRELTLAWSRYGYQGEIIEADSIDTIMTEVSKTDADICLIQSPGHIIDERWYLPVWQKVGFYQAIQQLVAEQSFLFAAEIEPCQADKKQQSPLSFKNDCMLVDVKRYRDMGCPAFSNKTNEAEALHCHVSEAGLSHDKDLNAIYRIKEGNNWVRCSFEQDITVPGLGADMNHCRFNLNEGESFCGPLFELLGTPLSQSNKQTLGDCQQSRFIQKIEQQVNNAKNGVFLFNIESYQELSPQTQRPLDALFSVAAGFKPYRILLEKGFTPTTQMVFFDYSESALEIKKYIVEHWDGYDFPKFVKSLFTQFPHPEVFYQLWDNTTPSNLDWDDVDYIWRIELEKWGGAEAFALHWRECRQLPHQYIVCDLLQDRQALLKEVAKYQHSYIWWSNAFFTIFSHWHFDATERKQHYIDWIHHLAEAAPECQVSGADHNNTAVNGFTAKQYDALFDRKVTDQLTVQKLHHTDMQF